jgi:hypothetical protein
MSQTSVPRPQSTQNPSARAAEYGGIEYGG